MPLNLIAAIDLNHGIGYQGKLPWHIPEDLRYFKDTTSNYTIIMGRNTFESIGSKPLKNRKNIVISSKPIYFDNVISLNIESVYNYIRENRSKENIFIIGGSRLYNEFINMCDKLYITQVYQEFKVDTYFKIDKTNFKCIYKSGIKKYNEIEYEFQIYQR